MSTFLRSKKGSALITVLILIFMMGILTTSMLKYSGGERRGNERNRLILRARNMAENVALYASEQVSTKVRRLRSVTPIEFTGTNALNPPPSSVLTTQFSTSSDVAVYGGIASTTPMALITDTTDANYGLQVSTGNIPIISEAAMTHPALGTVRAYVEQDLQINMVPLFQFAIFYDGDLEVSPGADMVISGPVHTNGNLIARSQTGFSNVVQFTDRVTAVGGFFANTGQKGTIYNEYDGADTGPGGDGPLRFQNPSGTVTAIKNSSNVWRDHNYGNSSVTTTSLANFKTFATTSYAGNLLSSVHNVPQLKLPGLEDTADNQSRSTIEPADSADNAALEATKFSRNAGLYIVVNPDNEVRTGVMPDASTVTLLPYSYRCWLNTTSSTGTHTFSEVVLPGQPSFGYNNNGTPSDSTDDFMYRNRLPNRYTRNTAVGSNQVLRISQQPFSHAAAYQLNGIHALGSTTLALKTGSGPVYPGQLLTIGSYTYLVTRALAGGTVGIAAPGLRGSVVLADSTAVTVGSPVQGTAPSASGYQTNGAHLAGTTTINIDASTASIHPGNNITISGNRYLVTSAPTTFASGVAITIQPALAANTADNVAVNLTRYESSLGTAMGYLINNSAGYAAGATSLAVDSGGGTLLPGNLITVAGHSYVVTATAGSPVTSVTIATGLADVVADNAMVMLDPYQYTGYPTGAYSLGNAGTVMPDAYFFDLRRSTNSNGHPFSRNTATFTPRPISKVDFDMARFKMTVGRTLAGTAATVNPAATSTTGYNVDVPNSTNWSNNILKSDATTTTLSHGVGTSFTTMPAATDASTRTVPDPFRIYFAPNVSTPPAGYASYQAALEDDPSIYATGSGTFTDPWYDGITVYIHSIDAETLTESSVGVRNRIDSGVRLWNGRGPAPTLTSTGKTGLSFATNDAIYIVGHFNADGTIVANASTTTNPGGYSGRYPETSSEKLTSVMGDAITILSQPVFTTSGSNYVQSSGWSDSLSGHRVRASNWNSAWPTTNPGSGNGADGVNTSLNPSFMPNLGTYSPGAGSAADLKFAPTVTEISACLLTGVVETDSRQHSGGVHNYPRLLESWAGTGLYIRGSMVAMFYSEIATEPWSIRIYSGAGRYWGLHESLRDANHDVPLEPILLNAQRLSFRELTKTEYDAKKTVITALP